MTPKLYQRLRAIGVEVMSELKDAELSETACIRSIDCRHVVTG